MLLGRLLLELVIARVCVRPSASLLPLLPAKSASPACLLGMPSVFNPLARERLPMSPARAAPGWSPPRAVLAGRVLQLASALAMQRGAHRGSNRGRGGPPPGREPSGGGRRRRAAQVGHGAASGAAQPHLCSPEAPPREPYPPEAVRRPLRGPRDRAGAVKAHMNPRGVRARKTNAAERRRQSAAPIASRSCPAGPIHGAT